ncbi:MAG: DUF4097 domain-containing protein [Phycisphaerales bacterium]|nr:DUF4097 domain-containing protein [Phycisphaerales bacterium]
MTSVFSKSIPARFAAACLIGLGTMALGGCKSAPPVTVTGLDALKRSPSVALDVENPKGSVLVYVDSEATTPRVIARAGKRTGEPSENYNGDRWVTAKITETDGRAVLTVRNTERAPEEANYWVQLIVVLPSCDGVRIKNSEGLVDVRGVSGAVQIENGGAGLPGGPVQFESSKPITAPVTITTAGGNVDVIFATGTTGNIELLSGNGMLANISAWTGQLEHSTHKPGSFKGVLNRGQNPVKIKTNEGQIDLRVGPYRFGNPHIKYYKQWTFS